jgi:cytochrome c oxidase cbb3-type subunit 3
MPNWWLFILFGSIVFGFGYWFVYQTTKSMPNPGVEYATDIAAIKAARLAANPMSDEALTAQAANPALVEEGHQVFMSTCASCHGQKAEGLVGPNLTDKFWLHGNKPSEIVKSVDQGYAEKGMPAWGPPLGAEKIRKVALFVLSVRNTNVAGKEPQGDPLE